MRRQSGNNKQRRQSGNNKQSKQDSKVTFITLNVEDIEQMQRKRKQSHQFHLQEKQQNKMVNKKYNNNRNRMNKKNDFIEKLYQKRTKLNKIQIINKFSFNTKSYLDTLKGLVDDYPQIFQNESSLPSSFMELSLDSNLAVYKKQSKKYQQKLLQVEQKQSEGKGQSQDDDDAMFLNFSQIKKLSMDYHDLSIFQQIRQSNDEQNNECDQLDVNVFDNLQMVKSQLKNTNKVKNEKMVVIDDCNDSQQNGLKRDYNLREQIFPDNKKNNEFSIFMLFTKLVTKLTVDKQVWYYKDPQYNIQGPFSSVEMDSWNTKQYFPDDLNISWIQKDQFITLNHFQNIPEILIFTTHKYKNITNLIRMQINQLESNSIQDYLKLQKNISLNSSNIDNLESDKIIKVMRKISVDADHLSNQVDPQTLMMDTEQIRQNLQ